MKRRIYSLVTAFVLIFTSVSFGHSGRTDSRGGHRDNRNVSGLGSYHYHCGGYPAHLHTNGVCPYSAPNQVAPKPKSTKKVTEKKVDVVINGNPLPNSSALQVGGRTLVAIRPIFDELGISLHWEPETQTVIGQKDNNILQLTIGNKLARINNETIELDVAGQIRNGKTLVPARFIAESLGASIDFDNINNTVIIASN